MVNGKWFKTQDTKMQKKIKIFSNNLDIAAFIGAER